VKKIIKQHLQYSKGTREKWRRHQCHFSRITPVHTWLLALWTPTRNRNGTFYHILHIIRTLLRQTVTYSASLKEHLGGKIFSNNDELIQDVQERLHWQPKDFVLSGIRKLPDRWGKCIANQGGYVEK